ncbi:hypothetical protein LH464_21370 [Neorhizobium sp. T786]|uniref:hypothetical protein n=1 Tax=Pseudorhizobium xiangyangii TaxID=2883104 RepID=UPI001CFF9399|nr:hypothetical protein [Neorhizobium xiangyangii]MCB5205020.1 hypothetical protein [Neorhizobium xiangyangii]
MDGNHSNDEPTNLVLIDGIDHMRIHGMSVERNIDRWNSLAGKRAEADAECQRAYDLKAESGLPWVEVAKIVYGNQKPRDDRPWHDIAQPLANRTRKYAKRKGIAWPPIGAPK